MDQTAHPHPTRPAHRPASLKKERGIWLMLLALAGEVEDRDADGHLTGRLGTAEEIAWHLHTRLERIQPSLERLVQLGLLHQNTSGILAIADFAADQAADTPAERMQRHRTIVTRA